MPPLGLRGMGGSKSRAAKVGGQKLAVRRHFQFRLAEIKLFLKPVLLCVC
jgi:hypothetical protein